MHGRGIDDVRVGADEDMLGDDLEAWMDESSLMRRTFRQVAIIAGLIERRSPGQEKSSRQISVNSDLIFDVLRQHEPVERRLVFVRQGGLQPDRRAQRDDAAVDGNAACRG